MAGDSGFSTIVLAAGIGSRMKSQLAKALHPLLGKPLVCYPIDAALAAGATRVVVVIGHQRERIEQMLRERYDGQPVTTAVQPEPLGTGDAARCGSGAVADAQWLLVVNGDAALLTARTLEHLVAVARAAPDAQLCMLTSELPDATGYGRILRDESGKVIGVREERDCTEQERAIREWNPGVYAIRNAFFRAAVAKLSSDNAQGELYLTDLVAMAAEQGGVAELKQDASELHGINDRRELAARERDLRYRRAAALSEGGVTVRDPDSTFIDDGVAIEPDAVIHGGVHLRGRCRIGAGAVIDVGCVLTDVVVAAGAQLLPYTVATDSAIGEGARVGPFSHLRPGSELGPEVHVGNFVETKKSRLGRGAKANHLSYLGDGVIGERVNIGAGTIFCNYDGFMKHQTTLEDGVFIGSDSQLVAPVTVGKDAYVATATTVTTDVPPGALAVGRARQVNKPDFGTRLRARLKAAADEAKKPTPPDADK